MKRIVVAASLALVILTACGGGSANGDTPSTTPSESGPCIEFDVLEAHRDKASAQLTKAQHVLGQLDIAGAVTALRIAASEVRSMADTVAEVAPLAEGHFSRSADSLDKSATDLDDFNVDSATSYILQGVNEMSQGVKGVKDADYC